MWTENILGKIAPSELLSLMPLHLGSGSFSSLEIRLLIPWPLSVQQAGSLGYIYLSEQRRDAQKTQEAQTTGRCTAGFLPNTHTWSQDSPPSYLQPLSCLLSQASDFWSLGKGDEMKGGPSLSFRGIPTTSSSQRSTRHRACVTIKGYLFLKVKPIS